MSLGKINATLKNGLTAETIALEDAIALIDAKGGVPTKKKATAKAKKPAAKAAGYEETGWQQKAPAKKTATKAPVRKAKSA